MRLECPRHLRDFLRGKAIPAGDRGPLRDDRLNMYDDVVGRLSTEAEVVRDRERKLSLIHI